MNWRNRILIKDDFEENTTPELIIKLCDKLIPQLNNIKEKELNSNLCEKDYVTTELFECIDNFEFLKSLANGNIPEDEWVDYNFYGDFEEWFNDYLDQLYDLGDKIVKDNNNNIEKFIWIG